MMIPRGTFGTSAALAALVLTGSIARAGPQLGGQGIPPIERNAYVTVYTIMAEIDGRSQLVLDDRTAQWLHYDFAAPGRLDCDHDGIQFPTYIRGFEWYPVWPDVPNCENRYCNCSSDVVNGVVPAIPDLELGVTLENVVARGAVTIVEYPTIMNDYRIVIEFDDNPLPGADWYSIDLTLWKTECVAHCTSTMNSTGQVAGLDAIGSMRLELNEFRLRADKLPPKQWGIYFFGVRPAKIPFGNGYLCIDPFFPGLLRLDPVVVVSDMGEAIYPLDFQNLPEGMEMVPGTQWFFQFWYRDPLGGGSLFNLSDGMRAVFCP